MVILVGTSSQLCRYHRLKIEGRKEMIESKNWRDTILYKKLKKSYQNTKQNKIKSEYKGKNNIKKTMFTQLVSTYCITLDLLPCTTKRNHLKNTCKNHIWNHSILTNHMTIIWLIIYDDTNIVIWYDLKKLIFITTTLYNPNKYVI